MFLVHIFQSRETFCKNFKLLKFFIHKMQTFKIFLLNHTTLLAQLKVVIIME